MSTWKQRKNEASRMQRCGGRCARGVIAPLTGRAERAYLIPGVLHAPITGVLLAVKRLSNRLAVIWSAFVASRCFCFHPLSSVVPASFSLGRYSFSYWRSIFWFLLVGVRHVVYVCTDQRTDSDIFDNPVNLLVCAREVFLYSIQKLVSFALMISRILPMG